MTRYRINFSLNRDGGELFACVSCFLVATLSAFIAFCESNGDQSTFVTFACCAGLNYAVCLILAARCFADVMAVMAEELFQ